jgi:hypothetical protein
MKFIEKYSNIKFNKTSSIGSRVVPFGDRRKDRQTDMSKLIVAFLNFANATTNSKFCPQNVLMCFIPTSEQRAINSQYKVNFIFVTKTEVFTVRYDRNI